MYIKMMDDTSSFPPTVHNILAMSLHSRDQGMEPESWSPAET